MVFKLIQKVERLFRENFIKERVEHTDDFAFLLQRKAEYGVKFQKRMAGRKLLK